MKKSNFLFLYKIKKPVVKPRTYLKNLFNYMIINNLDFNINIKRDQVREILFHWFTQFSNSDQFTFSII